MRTVRNFMKLGRSRHSSRDSSTEDEGRSLVTDSDDAGTALEATQPYDAISQTVSTQSQSAASSDVDESVNNEKIKK